MSPDFPSRVLELCERATAVVAGRLLADFGSARARTKPDGSLVTPSDTWADETLRHLLGEAFPEHGLLTEEGSRTFPDTEWCWVVDPIDGTTNFARGVPLWCISLGLLHRGHPVFGYVRVPTLGRRFHGWWPGSSGVGVEAGAFLDGRPLRSRAQPPTANHFLSLCSRSAAVLAEGIPCKARMLGVATYNLLSVAAGTMLGAVESTPKVWDLAGPWPVLHAAGACWIPLGGSAPFPLEPGVDYTTRAWPTLVLAGPELRAHLEAPVRRALGRRAAQRGRGER